MSHHGPSLGVAALIAWPSVASPSRVIPIQSMAMARASSSTDGLCQRSRHATSHAPRATQTAVRVMYGCQGGW